MSTLETLLINELNSGAKISPVPGLFTQIFSSVNISPFFIFWMLTTDAYAKSITGCSSGSIFLIPPLAFHISLDD